MRPAVGDSDFAANQLLQANVPNAVLLANALNWLVEREALLGIPPKKTEQVKLTLTSDEFWMIVLLAFCYGAFTSLQYTSMNTL